ncbi:hypothetical protein BDW75DRAFT_226316 [Aspergillus navahoensis]
MVEPIAVIGSGCRFSGGSDTPSKLWSLIRTPHDLSKKPPASRFNIDPFYHPVGTHHGTTNATKSFCSRTLIEPTSANSTLDSSIFSQAK